MKARIFIGLALLSIALLVLAVQGLRQQQVRSRPMLDVQFDHHRHAQVGCASCHHNFLDNTGAGTCYSCHKQDSQLALSIEPMFHDFCESCHIEKAQKGKDHGPIRRCSGCHVDDGIQ